MTTPGRIYTIGYRALSGLSELVLAQHRTGAVVVDVRLKPWGFLRHWNRSALAQALGSKYRWIEAFGNVNYKGGGPIVLKDPEAGIAAVSPLLAAGPILLLCACDRARGCHRTTVANALLDSGHGREVVHFPAASDRNSHQLGLL